MPIHVFFDNSNIWGGAHAVRQAREPHVPWVALRLYYRNLFSLLEGGRKVETAILGGSVPPSCEPLWQYARDNGYDTKLLRRVARDDGSVTEQGVDEVLHLMMANTAAKHRNDAEKIMVLATGDGKLSEFGTSFPGQIRLALDQTWNVEIWSWSPVISKEYARLQSEFPNKITVNMLDNFYECVTFVKDGSYYLQTPNGPLPVSLAGRIVQPLPRA